MVPETTKMVEVLDPRNGKLVPRAASLYLLALSTDNDSLILCRAQNPNGNVLQDSDARKIYAAMTLEMEGIPYQCSPDVCGYCLSEDKK